MSKKGQFMYDYKHDILTFQIHDRDYQKSLEMQNFVIDIDTENQVKGIRIFDVSTVSGLQKNFFRNLVNGRFEAAIQDNVVSIRLNIVGKIRNRLIPLFCKEKNYTQQISVPFGKQKVQDSEVVANIAA